MSDTEVRVNEFVLMVDSYCYDNEAALAKGETPDVYPVEYSSMEGSNPAIGHCAVIELLKMRLAEIRVECAHFAPVMSAAALARLFWAERKLTEFGEHIAETLLPKRHLVRETMAAKRVDPAGVDAEVRACQTCVLHVRNREGFERIFDGPGAWSKADPELRVALTAVELMPAEDGMWCAVEIMFDLLTAECVWAKRETRTEPQGRPVFMGATGREDMDRKVWPSFVRRRDADSMVPPGRAWEIMVNEFAGLKLVTWSDPETMSELWVMVVDQEVGTGAGGAVEE